jgi:AcrR family transcriptional regulator
MFKKAKKSEATRARVLDCALALFRKRGFDKTTMRDVADAAGLALGAAYYYFPSKDAILLAWYARNQSQDEARLFTGTLRERLGRLTHGKLDTVKRERKLLGALVQRLADPGDPVSAFAKETAEVRRQSMALIARALEPDELPDELKQVLLPSLWMLQMGLLLYFIHDRSPQQEKSHRLADDLLDLIVPLVRLGAAAPHLTQQLARTLGRAGLLQQT